MKHAPCKIRDATRRGAGARTLRLFVLACFAAHLASAALPGAAAAHPLGNFTINRYSRLEPGGDRLRVLYVLDMAEIPALQERQTAIDHDRDGRLSEDEREGYAARKAEELRRGLWLRLDGAPAELRLLSRELTFPEGQGGLSLLRLHLLLETGTPVGTALSAEYRDRNYEGRIGWKEVVVRPGLGASLLESDAPSTDSSDELRAYPDDLLSSPLDRTGARFRFRASEAGQPVEPAAVGQPSVGQPSVGQPSVGQASMPALAARDARSSQDPVAALAAVDQLTLPVVLFSLLAAAFWGALHALSPGHGKTVVAAYLVGARGTARHAAVLGLTVTATHTLGVYLLGLLTLYLSQYVLPEQLYPWLGLLSGLAVVAMGAWLFGRRLSDVLAVVGRRTAGRRSPTAVAVAGGHPHGHVHGHEHGHSDYDLAHEHGHMHHDRDHGHSHLPPGADGERLGWRGLVALGVSGGLLPCPSALVLMLATIALGRVAYGLLLVVAFSAGLAAVLVALGLLLVYARHLFTRLPATTPLLRLVPIGSALVILTAGLFVTGQSLAQTGLWPM